MDQIEELTPASYSLDPRYVYPDPLCGENVQAGRGIFELDKKTVKGVMELAKQPAYIKPQLKKAIEQGPTTGSAMSRLDVIEDRDKVAGDLFEHWIYWGEIERDDLEAAGVELPEDDLDVVSACVEMINNVVVRAYLNPLADGALPYDFFPWERVPGSCLGLRRAVPDARAAARHQRRVADDPRQRGRVERPADRHQGGRRDAGRQAVDSDAAENLVRDGRRRGCQQGFATFEFDSTKPSWPRSSSWPRS
jgi:hypothetical protein